VKLTIKNDVARETEVMTGAEGGGVGVTGDDAEEATDVPVVFVATTVKV
jgi:hypothetical protein